MQVFFFLSEKKLLFKRNSHFKSMLLKRFFYICYLMKKTFLLLFIFCFSMNVNSQIDSPLNSVLKVDYRQFPSKIENQKDFDIAIDLSKKIYKDINFDVFEFEKHPKNFVNGMTSAIAWAEKNENLQTQLLLKKLNLSVLVSTNNSAIVIKAATELLSFKKFLTSDEIDHTLDLLARAYRWIEAYNEIIKLTPTRKYYVQNDAKRTMDKDYELSLCYFNTKNYKKAISSFAENKKFYVSRKDFLYTSSMTNNIGLCYYKLHDFVNAKKYYLQALREMKDIKKNPSKNNDVVYNQYFESIIKNNIAKIDTASISSQKAIDVFKELLLNAKKVGNKGKSDVVDAHLSIAKSYLKSLNLKLSEKHLDSVFDAIDNTTSTATKIDFFNTKSSLHLLQGNQESAFRYQFKSKKLADSIAQVQIFRDNILTQVKYEISEKNNQLREAKKQSIEREKSLQVQKFAIIFGIVALLFLCILLYFLYKLSEKQKKTNQDLEQQKSIIEQNNRELSRFNLLNQKIFGVIAHDFKTPLLLLQNLLSRKENLDNKQIVKLYLNDIENQILQTDEILTNLVDWAKTELNVDSINQNEIILKNIVDQTIFGLQNKIETKKLVLKNNILANTKIIFNELVLKIILRNIITNAIKFSFEQGIIEIDFSDNLISIKDFGKGIDVKKLQTIFKKHIEPALGTNFESGFGIGLYLCNELIIKHNGALNAFNNEHKGATFQIIFRK